MTLFLSLFLALLPAVTPVPTGSVTGKVQLVKAGASVADSSNCVVWIEGAHRAAAGLHAMMKSEKKAFTPRVVVVSRQSVVDFPNVDPVYHNVFSVSGANRFDLGLYRAGASKEKEFDEPGLVRVYCNIHPTMIGYVMVVDSDFASVTGPDGGFRFEGVPTGTYKLKLWNPEVTAASEMPIAVRLRADTPVAPRLDVTGFRLEPHKNKYGKDYAPPPSDDERY